MKIFSIYECEISGGTDRLLIHLIKNWPQKNDHWTLFCHTTNSGNNLISQELSSDASIYKYNNNQKLHGNKFTKLFYLVSNIAKDYFYFKKQIKKHNPDILFLMQGGYPAAFSAHAAAQAAKNTNPNIKIIMSIQNLPSMRDKKIFSKVLDYFSNKNIDRYVFASKQTVNEYVNKTPLDRSKFNIIPEGVNANSADKTLTNNTNCTNIGIIGSYEPRKGRSVLFDATKILIDQGISNFRIFSYGQKQFADYEKCRQHASILGISDKIEWCDFESDFDKLYGNLDIITQPSTSDESMPLVPLDAAAYYKPVIASKLQGLIDEIIHNETGYLFDIGDSNQLAFLLKDLITNPDKRIQMGNKARQRYLNNFTAEIMANKYLTLFQNEFRK